MRVYYTAKQIDEAVTRVANELNAQYRDATNDARVVVVCVLKGAALFFADLVRKLNFPLEFDFVRTTSYGAERQSSGVVTITKDVETPLQGRRVLIVEDVVDTGRSLARLRQRMRELGADDVKIAVLIDKKAKRAVDVRVDFVGMEAEDLYLVGYGLDDGEHGRQLPDLWVVE